MQALKMGLGAIIHSFTFPRAPKREPRIVLHEYIQGVYRYEGYSCMAKVFAEKAQQHAIKHCLEIVGLDKKMLDKYLGD